MYFASGSCGNDAIYNIVKFVLKLLDILYIIVPIGLIVFVAIDFGKNVIANNEDDMSKNLSKVFKRILMCLLFFLVPIFVNFTVRLVGSNGDNFFGCIAEARSEVKPVYQRLWDSITHSVYQITSRFNPLTVKVLPSNDGGGSNRNSYDSTIFIGDSRTVHMCGAVDMSSSESCIAKSAEGVEWFRDTAIPDLKSRLSSNSKVNVAIMMGTNDVMMGSDRPSAYASLYNDLMATYSDTNFVIISVTQVDDDIMSATGKGLHNSNIQTFNNSLKSGLNDSSVYCDVYSDIDGKYSTIEDGIHYDDKTSKLIYDSIHKCL